MLLLVTICLRIVTLFGSMNVTLLYTREKFGWDGGDYSTYTTIDGVLGITGKPPYLLEKRKEEKQAFIVLL